MGPALLAIMLAAPLAENREYVSDYRDGYALELRVETLPVVGRQERLYLVPRDGRRDDKQLVAAISDPRGRGPSMTAAWSGPRTVRVCAVGKAATRNAVVRFSQRHGGATFHISYGCPAGDIGWIRP
jgi:hypothetical protein